MLYYPEVEWSYKQVGCMIIQVSIVLGLLTGTDVLTMPIKNDHHLVVKTLVAVNNSPTQGYNLHSPNKSYSTLLKYYRQPKLLLAISCA